LQYSNRPQRECSYSTATVHIAFFGCKMKHQVSTFGFVAVTNGLFQTHRCSSVCLALFRPAVIRYSAVAVQDCAPPITCISAHELSRSPIDLPQYGDAVAVQKCINLRIAVLHTAVVTICTTWFNIKTPMFCPDRLVACFLRS
jgi:hypothetical protein